MYGKIIITNIRNGIHTRIAAMVVHKAMELKGRFGVNLYIRKTRTKESLAISMLALLSLKIMENDEIEISCDENTENGINAVHTLCDFLTNGMAEENTFTSNIDSIIEETTIANEQILKNIPIGILVIDLNSRITSINEYASKLLNKNESAILGMYVKDIIPNSDLPFIIEKGISQVGEMQQINNRLCIVNRTPIFYNNKIIGAIGVFQDVSELVGIKELNERLQTILETSHDLICFVDEHRKINYINPAYEKYYGVKMEDLQGKDLNDISPSGLRMSVFNSKKKIDNLLYHKEGIDTLATIEPIFIDNKFKGVITICKPVNEIKDLINKLEKSQAQIKFYKEQLKDHSTLNICFNNIIGSSGNLKDSLIIANKAAASTSNVLIRGESGTGKELIANAIHNASARKDKPFVRVNCASIPENLLESELFGHEKGAFTGAIKSKPGKFMMADGGSIFLDEIGDMPLSMQVKLLRVLQEREFESVGGIVTHKVDVRIIAATHRNLERMIENGIFREDLYYRLNVMTVSLPPLRDRKQDINLLCEDFIAKISLRLGKNIRGIDSECLSFLQNYDWPGNIRELQNIIERAINLCDGNMLSTVDFPFYITNTSVENKENTSLINLRNGELLPIEEYEKELITIAMKKYGSYNKAGKALGLTHRTVSLKCKKYGIDIVEA